MFLFPFLPFARNKSFPCRRSASVSLLFRNSAFTVRWLLSSESIFSCLSEAGEREKHGEKRSNKEKMLSIGKFVFLPSKYVAASVWEDFYYVQRWGDATLGNGWSVGGMGWREDSPRETQTRLTKFDPIFQNACRCDVFLVSWEGNEWFEMCFFLARWGKPWEKQRSLIWYILHIYKTSCEFFGTSECDG